MKASWTFRSLLFSISLLFWLCANAQPWSNQRSIKIDSNQDTIQIDSLSVVPGSFKLKNYSGVAIDSSKYIFNSITSQLIFIDSSVTKDSMVAEYRVFPYSFSKPYYTKEFKKAEADPNGLMNPFLITYEEGKNEIFMFGGLTKSGSISRGVSFGNNQDVVLNSSLNLQMSGQITENVDVLASISDENIPFQPEGNTQQLQEFDKVFIQLSNKNNKLIAGDYELRRPNSYFMNFYKKAQGGSFSTTQIIRRNKNDEVIEQNKTELAAAVSKGKYSRNLINGEEGNQGPYRLTGSNNELYIFVLSGSEKVYINGEVMVRGSQNDYIIDYNTAQISFTTRRLITKDSRIVVEFQFSDLNYLRSLIHVNNELSLKKWKLNFNFFTEQDAKNQALNQKLSDDEKKVMSLIGDSLGSAVVPNVLIDTSEINRNLIHYKKQDSLVAGILYADVFVYSTSIDSAIYNVGFSLVGPGKGNYNPANTSANGRVYQWIAPIAGIPQGSYEPVRLLISPKSQQLFTLGTEYQLNRNTKIFGEGALSNYNKNTFSELNKEDDVGFAGRIGFANSIPLTQDSAGWKFNTTGEYEHVQDIFNPLERFRPVEFDRDWNLIGEKFSGNENLYGGSVGISKVKNGYVQYRYRNFSKGSDFDGNMHSAGTDMKIRKFRLVSSASHLNSESILKKTKFLRHRADFSKSLRYLTIGIKEDAEQNRFINKSNDSLQAGSYSFKEWEAYLTNPDTTINKFRIYYGQRYDDALKNNSFQSATKADNTGISTGLLRNPNHTVTTNSSYRKLSIRDTTLTLLKSEETLLNSIEHGLILFKGALHFTSYFEIGTGQEQKKEFAFLEVAAGQGVYEWRDYNSNGIQEFDEFEISSVSSLAKFVKVLVPTNEYIRANSNQFSEVFVLNPSSFFDNPTGFKKLIARFSNQLMVRKETKTTDKRLERAINPFYFSDINDTTLITAGTSIQNIFYFNRSGSRLGFDFGITENENKSLLTNGYETQTLSERTLNGRWNITRIWGINGTYKWGSKEHSSEFFKSRDYNLLYQTISPKLIIQTTATFRIVVLYEYTEKKNSGVLEEQSFQNKAGTEIKWSSVKKGTAILRFNYINIDFNAAENSPLAYEMLEGFSKGDNFTWGFSVQRTLSSGLQLSLNYEGRKTQSNVMIHTGGVQLRAYF